MPKRHFSRSSVSTEELVFSMLKKNSSATDLWEQMFERASTDLWATIMDPEYDETADQQKFVAAMSAAGWSAENIKGIIEEQIKRRAVAPVTGPGINRDVEYIMDKIASDVEAAMTRLKITSHTHVARGIEPRVGPFASKIGVIMTEESIVTISAFFPRFCGLIARAFTRTLQLNPFFWEDNNYTHESGRDLLLNSLDLARYWFKIYCSFSVTGTHATVPYRPSAPREVMIMEQVARGMEVFTVAHEYSHHHLEHGRDIQADPREEEFAADLLALKICDEVDRMRQTDYNPYLVSGAGGAILLMALETLRFMDELLGAPHIKAETHPQAADRIRRFDSVYLLQPREFQVLKSFRVTSVRIMKVVHEIIVLMSSAWETEDLKKLKDFREKMRPPS